MIIPSADIRGMTVPWLLQSLGAEGRTGILTFSRQDVVIKVFFQDGDISFAASNCDDYRLGECLLTSGKITLQQFDASTDIIKKTGKKQGAVLVELGFISPQDLVWGVKLQVRLMVLSVFTWREGRYVFEEGPVPSEVIPLQMSTGNLILESVRRLDWKFVSRSLPPLNATLRPSTNPAILFQRADFEQDQLKILSLIDGNRSIEQICSASEIGDFNTLKAIYVLLALKMIETGELKTDEEKQFVREVVKEKITARVHEQGPGAGSQGEASSPRTSRQKIQDAFNAMNDQDHYKSLGVARNATMQELKKAYFGLAKLYHPDRHFEAEMSDMKKMLGSLFAGIHNAYQTLSNPVLRAEYDQASVKKAGGTNSGHADRAAETKKDSPAEGYFNAGMNDLKLGNFWGAAEYLSSAIRLDPAKSEYFYQYGIALMNIPRRMREAEENIKKAIDIGPGNPEYHLQLATLYMMSGLKTKALDVYRAALRENPESDRIKEALKAAEAQG